MKKLEEKIINKVYKFETKKTAISFVVKTVVFIILFFFTFVIGQAIYELLQESGSFDFLQIFNEDFEVIRKYLFENINIFFQEMPKLAFIILLILVSLLFWLLLTVVENFGIIKNKIRSLIKFWLSKNE